MCIRFEIYLLQYSTEEVLKKTYFETQTHKTEFIFELIYLYIYIYIFLPKFLNKIKLEMMLGKTTICLILQDMFRIHDPSSVANTELRLNHYGLFKRSQYFTEHRYTICLVKC